MGQDEVYTWLKDQYEMNNKQWFTIKDITKGLIARGVTNGSIKGIRADCIKLTVTNIIQSKDLDLTGWNNYKRVFRYERK
jgi:hypothetical protein